MHVVRWRADFASDADAWAHLIADNRIADSPKQIEAMLRELAEAKGTGDST